MKLPRDPYQITKSIWQGAYPDEERLYTLLKNDVYCILNVSGDREVYYDTKGFHKVFICPVEDQQRFPDQYVLRVLDYLYEVLEQQQENVFVHCTAGWNRSPTIVWLFLVACGISCENAARIIEERTLDAVPGHPQLVDQNLIQLVINHGSKNYLPLKRQQILEPVPLLE